jgi:hypothetical protein
MPEAVDDTTKRYTIINDNNSAKYASAWAANTGNTLVYLNRAISGPFSITARVKITRNHTFDTTNTDQPGASGNNGVFIGALSGIDEEDHGALRFAGLRHGLNGTKGMYISRSGTNDNSNTALGSAEDVNKEFIVKVERDTDKYTISILNNKTGAVVASNTRGSSNNVHGDLMPGAPVYPGFIISGVTAEISQIEIKRLSPTEVVFIDTPDSTPEVVQVSSITISAEEPAGADAEWDYQNTLANVSEGIQLNATVSPADADNPAVTWSEAEDVAEVAVSEDGLVTFTGAADVTIRATAQDGSGVSDEFKIRITAEAPKVESVTISGPATVMATRSITLEAEVSPAAVEDKGVTWTVGTNSDGSGDAAAIATIDEDGVLTGVGAGTVYVIATSTGLNESGNTVASSPHTVTVTAYVPPLWEWEAGIDADFPTSAGASNAVLINDKHIILKAGSTLAKNEDGSFTFGTGIRLIIGDTADTNTTSSTSTGTGEFDFSTGTFKITVTCSAMVNDAGNFQIYINNNTGTQANSPLGSQNRLRTTTGAVGDMVVTFSAATFSGATDSLEKAFVCLRTDGGQSLKITKILIEEVTEE